MSDTRTTYIRKVLKTLSRAVSAKRSKIWNHRSGRYYTTRYLRSDRAARSPYTMGQVARAHERAAARGVKGLPTERYTGTRKGAELGRVKVPRGYLATGQVRAVIEYTGGLRRFKGAARSEGHLKEAQEQVSGMLVTVVLPLGAIPKMTAAAVHAQIEGAVMAGMIGIEKPAGISLTTPESVRVVSYEASVHFVKMETKPRGGHAPF